MLRTTLALTTLSLAVSAQATSEPATLNTPSGTLHGTLELPKGQGPHPVALIIPGSGPTDRDGNSAALPGKNDSLKMLAQGLAQHGVASLRIDKRLIGQSQTGQTEADLTLDSLVNDAAAWLQQLQNDPRFNNVAVIGHSEGALIGMLAAQKTNANAFVSLAGPGENLADTITRQLRANPHNPPALVNEAERIIAELRAGRRVAQVSPLLMPLFRPSVQPYTISAFKYDPAQEIAKLKVPTLIIQGDRDLQVGVADAQKLKAARADAELKIIPGMNHVLKNTGSDVAVNQRAYIDPSLPLNAKLDQTIAQFLKEAAER